MKRINAKTILPVATAAIAMVFVYMGVAVFGFWDPVAGPKSGFYPTLAGIVLLLISALTFYLSWSEKPPVFPRQDLLVAGGAFAFIMMSYVVGLMPSMVLYLMGWMKLVEKSTWSRALKITAAVGIVAYGVFGLWLEVPFPKGLLFEPYFE